MQCEKAEELCNIKKVVGYLLGTNIGEVITVFTAMMLWHKTPLLSMQLLWINLVTDSLPAIALGMEAVESEVMTQKPKTQKRRFIRSWVWRENCSSRCDVWITRIVCIYDW